MKGDCKMEAKKLIHLFDREGYLKGDIIPGYLLLGIQVSIEKGEINPDKYYYRSYKKPLRLADVDAEITTGLGRKSYLFSID